MQGDLSKTLKSLIQGKYQYLTYLLSSTACIYFWLAPNHHKMQLIKPVARVVRQSPVGKPKYKSSKKYRNNGSQYIIYNDKLMKVDEVSVQDENAEMEF